MTRSELYARVAARSSLSKADVAAALSAPTALPAALSDGDTATVASFRKFTPRTRAASQGRNPRTGEPLSLAPRPGCRPSTPQRACATGSPHSASTRVKTHPAPVAATRSRHNSVSAMAPCRHPNHASRNGISYKVSKPTCRSYQPAGAHGQ